MMRRFLPFLVVCLISCVSVKRQERAASRLELGNAYLNENNTPAAIEVLEQSVELDPRNVWSWNKLGLAYMQAGSLERSGDAFKRAVRLDPEQAEIQNNYGTMLLRAGRLDEAIEAFEVAAADLTYRKPALVLSNLGYALYQAERFIQAKEVLDQAVVRAPNLCQARFNRGLVQVALKRPEKGIEDFEVVIRMCGDEALGAYHQAGVLLLQLGEVVAGCDYLGTVVHEAGESQLRDEAEELRARECLR